VRVAIIGGGISGLATAFFIQQQRPDWEIHLYERNPRLGGTMQTVDRDGFLFEMGGNGFLTNKPDSLDLVKAAGAEHLLQKSSDEARIRYLYTKGLHRLPESPLAFSRSPLLTLPQKLRVLAELLIPAKGDEEDETVQHFGERRLGKAFTDTFLNAMIAGIYASTPGQTSINAAFPLVADLERCHGGLFRGMIKKRRKEAGPGGVLTSFHGGVSSFIHHLQESLKTGISTEQGVTAIECSDEHYQLHTPNGAIEADKVIIATPAYAASKIVKSLDAGLSKQLADIHYAPVAVVGLGYERIDHPLNGFGLLTTESARLPILGILWDSTVFPDRAPQGKQALRVMIGGLRNPELAVKDEEKLTELALQGIEQTMGCSTSPCTLIVKRWDKGIPSYPLGHLAKMSRLFATAARHPGLYLNSNAYYGISMNDCVANSRKTAERLIRETL